MKPLTAVFVLVFLLSGCGSKKCVTQEYMKESKNFAFIEYYQTAEAIVIKGSINSGRRIDSPTYHYNNETGTLESYRSLSFNPDTVILVLGTGKILKGIVFDLNTFETSYRQRQTDYGEPIQLKNENLLVIKDENSEYVDGDSVFVTLVPLIKKLTFVDKCLMRSAMRTGVPNLDVIIKEFRGEAAPINADAWDLGKAYMEGRKIGQNWSNSTVLTHPDCIELKPMEWGKMGMDPIKVVNFFNERILYALVPRDFTENKGIAISQTGTSSLDMLNLWARGEQTEIERPFLAEWDRILALNGKEGWRVEIVWREMTPDSGPEIWNRVRIARDVGVFTPDEIREIAGYPPLTEDQRAEIARIPAKGSNPGDKVDFGSNNGTDDRADVGPNPPPASFNDPDKKINGTPQQRDKKDSREVGAKGRRAG